MLNENRYDEMCQILLDLQKRYCPVVKTQAENDPVLKYLQILLDGDQLTKVRACGAIRLRENHEQEEQINGFQPSITDWHARMILVTVGVMVT